MRAAMAAAVAFALANALWSAWSQGWTYDEPVHLEWAERMLDTGVVERVSLRRFNSKTPATLPNVLLRKCARRAGVEDPRVLRFAARLPSVAWLALALAGVFALARPAFGPAPAMLAVIATSLDPNMAAHASLATVDEAYAASVVATLACAVAYARRPSWRRAAALGLALGLALMAKFSAVFLVAGLAVVPVLFRGGWPSPRRLAGHVAAIAGVVWLVVASWYLFLEIGRPVGDTPWRSAPFRALATAAPRLPAPAPTAFLTGLDNSLADERSEWGTVILGRRYPQGIWFYFGVLWLVKTPLLLLVALGAGHLAAARRLRADPVALFIAWILVFHLAYFSLVFRAQLGYRFVLMLVPLGYVVAAAGLAAGGLAASRIRLLALAGLFALAENLGYFGNPLAFTNAAIWPKRLAFRVIADSNIDWGQGREGIRERIARAGAGHTILEPLHILPGHNTLGLNAVAGVFDFERHRWLREHLTPGGHFGHTYLWYEVANDDYDRFLDESRRVRQEPWMAAACPPDLPLERHPPGERVRFALHTPPSAGDGFVVCVETRHGVDLGLRLKRGAIGFGRMDPAGGCAQAETMVEGQVSWYRLDAGRQALCLAEIPNRRPQLPYAVEGVWLVRGRAAALGLRRQTFTAATPPAPGTTSPRS